MFFTYFSRSQDLLLSQTMVHSGRDLEWFLHMFKLNYFSIAYFVILPDPNSIKIIACDSILQYSPRKKLATFKQTLCRKQAPSFEQISGVHFCLKIVLNILSIGIEWMFLGWLGSVSWLIIFKAHSPTTSCNIRFQFSWWMPPAGAGGPKDTL